MVKEREEKEALKLVVALGNRDGAGGEDLPAYRTQYTVLVIYTLGLP